MRFGGLVAVNDLSFQAGRGDITALIGPNGAGKTTVFNCITGFYKPTEGMIRAAQRDGSHLLLERLPGHAINWRAQGRPHVPEHPPVLRHDGAGEPAGGAAQPADDRVRLHPIRGARPQRLSQAEREAVEKAKAGSRRSRLIDRADDPAGDLPYGDQRRLEIARAMCTDPVLLCLDEPAAGLNPRESPSSTRCCAPSATITAPPILLIEHDMSVVMEISDHVVVLDYGTKISDGTPVEVKTDPRVIAAYLGVEDERGGARSQVEAEVGMSRRSDHPPHGRAHPNRTTRLGGARMSVAGINVMVEETRRRRQRRASRS